MSNQNTERRYAIASLAGYASGAAWRRKPSPMIAGRIIAARGSPLAQWLRKTKPINKQGAL